MLGPITDTGTTLPLTSAYRLFTAPDLHSTTNSDTYAMFVTIVASWVVNVLEVIAGFTQLLQKLNEKSENNTETTINAAILDVFIAINGTTTGIQLTFSNLKAPRRSYQQNRQRDVEPERPEPRASAI